jgi:HK97 family phage major capsid protein
MGMWDNWDRDKALRMEKNWGQIQDLMQKRGDLIDTGVNIYENEIDGKRNTAAAEKDLFGVVNKILSTEIAIAELGGPNFTTDETLDAAQNKDSKKAYNRLRALQADGKKPFNEPPFPDSNAGNGPGTRSKLAAVGPNEPKTFRNLFHGGKANVSLDRGGFKNMEEFLKTIYSGLADPRMKVSDWASGGYAVPEEFGAWLLDKSLEGEIVRPRATVWPMETDTRHVPAWNNFNHADNLYGGVTGQWLGEGAQANETEGSITKLTLIAKKLACYTKASNELLDDGVTFEQQLTNALIKGMGWFMDLAFLSGSGAGQPLGVLNDPALITVPRETAATITYADLAHMFARVAPACLNNAIWIANQTAIPSLLQLSVVVGAGGSHIPVLQQDGKGGFTILTRPVIFTEKVPALGSKGDILLADLSQYVIGMRREVVIAKSAAVHWTTDESAFRTIARVDGQGSWKEPVKPKNGDPVSWCVALG